MRIAIGPTNEAASRFGRLPARAAIASGTPSNRVRHDLSLKYGISPRHARRLIRIVELRFFGGLTAAETAHTLAVSEQTVLRDWRLARLWLLRELSGGER